MDSCRMAQSISLVKESIENINRRLGMRTCGEASELFAPATGGSGTQERMPTRPSGNRLGLHTDRVSQQAPLSRE